MKYYHHIAVAGIVFGIILSGVAVAAGQLFDRNLYFGLRGDADVQRFQQFLKEQGIYMGPVNGNFFALTRAAVQEFQKRHQIEPAAGYVGSKTRAVVNQLTQAEFTTPSSQLTLQEQITALLKQIESLQAELTQREQVSAPEATTTPPVTTIPVAPSVPSLPNPFPSTLKMRIDFPSITLSRYIGVTLTEFAFLAQEKIAITRLKFKNGGTLGDLYFLNLEIVDSAKDRIVATASTTKSSYIEFKMNPDATKSDKGVMVSGKVYDIRADILTPNSTEKPTVRLDLMSASDIDAYDYDDLTRVASVTPSMTFPILGPTISTF